MDLLGILSGTPRHRILTGRIRASVEECDSRLGTPDKTPGDLFSPFGSPPPAERESESGNWKDDRGTTLRVMS